MIGVSLPQGAQIVKSENQAADYVNRKYAIAVEEASSLDAAGPLGRGPTHFSSDPLALSHYQLCYSAYKHTVPHIIWFAR